MSDFNRCNKVTGVHWLRKSMEDVKIKVKIKPQKGILSLPKYEDYANESNTVNLHSFENKSEEYIFKWQEKVFSSWEFQRYTNVHNCLTDSELSYHDMIKSQDCKPSKIFTYIHDDYHLPLPKDSNKENKTDVLNLSACFDRLQLDEKMGRVLGEDSSSVGHLFRSEENITIEQEQWTAMHVVFDNSDYTEDSQLLLKQESTLLSLYHNKELGYLIVSPDVNSLELNPYCVEAEGTQWGYQYAIEILPEEPRGGDELATFLRKLLRKWEKKQRLLLHFALPPLGKQQYYVTVEILSAVDFEMDNLYIEFDIKIPDCMQCSDPLHGRTHRSTAMRTQDLEEWHFGHIIELSLEAAADTEPPPLKWFFEVISTDWWGRHRTEGYAYLPLALQPGSFSRQLSCSRPEETNKVAAENRRFFVGGCHLIKDLDVLANPQLQDANFVYVTTGCLSARWSVKRVGAVTSARGVTSPRGVTSAGVLRGAERVLRQYRRARGRLAAATGALYD